MSKIVHIQTQITAVFGLLDDSGDNVIQQFPITLQVSGLNKDLFDRALEHLALKKQELIEQNGQVTNVVPTVPLANQQ